MSSVLSYHPYCPRVLPVPPPSPPLVCSAQLVFVTLPTNQTVTEGGDAIFTCSVTVGDNPNPVSWQLRGGEGNIDQTVAVNTTDIPGVDSVVVTGSLRSPIILRNVSSSLDSLFVSCIGENAQGFLIEQTGPPAVLDILCELFEILCALVSQI